MRQAHLLDALSRSDRFQVHLLVPGRLRDDRVRAAVASVTELDVSDRDWSRYGRLFRRGADLWLSAVGRDPREASAQAPVRRAAAKAMRGMHPQIVIVEYAGMARLRRRSRAEGVTRWMLTCHNVLSRMAEHQAAVAPARRHHWLFRRDASKARRLERWMVGAFDVVVAVSDEDVAELPPGNVVVVPNGVELGRFTPSPVPDALRVVFTGAMYTGPNKDGAIWFCENVLPLVRAREPDVTVEIVGADPPGEVCALSFLPGVAVVGNVPSITPHLAGSRVAIVPLRIGSGTRLKVLEALAAGRPVVGTSLGLEGLGIVDGRHALVADDPNTFAEGVVRLLHDDQLATSLAVAGRALAEERYSWDRIGERFCSLVEGLTPEENGP